MPTFTTYFNLAKPLISDPTDEDQWGGYLNQDMDIIDAALKVSRDRIISVKTGVYSIAIGDRKGMFNFNATSGALVIPLLAAATAGNGFEVTVKKIDASTNTVTIDPNASELIDGQTTLVLPNQYDAVTLVCDGANWSVMSTSSGVGANSVGNTQVVPGFIVDSAVFKYTANTQLSNPIPNDGTVPQNNEGVQVIAATFTPKSITNKLRYTFKGMLAGQVNDSIGIAAAFLNSNTNATTAAIAGLPRIAGIPSCIEFTDEYVPGTVTTQNIYINVGPAPGSVAVYLNGNSGGQPIGNVTNASLLIEEIKV